MGERRDCAEVRALLPELAAGVAAGDERARVLRHLAGCADCRGELAALASVADELLTLVPAVEPPAGFESRVLKRITRPARQWPRRALRLVVTAALAAAIGVGLGGAMTMRATADDRRMADQCRKSIDDGEMLAGRDLTAAGTWTDASVFTYRGAPPWVFVVVRSGGVGGPHQVRLVTRDRVERVIGELVVTDGAGSWSGPIDVGVDRIAEIRLATAGSEPLIAVFP